LSIQCICCMLYFAQRALSFRSHSSFVYDCTSHTCVPTCLNLPFLSLVKFCSVFICLTCWPHCSVDTNPTKWKVHVTQLHQHIKMDRSRVSPESQLLHLHWWSIRSRCKLQVQVRCREATVRLEYDSAPMDNRFRNIEIQLYRRLHDRYIQFGLDVSTRKVTTMLLRNVDNRLPSGVRGDGGGSLSRYVLRGATDLGRRCWGTDEWEEVLSVQQQLNVTRRQTTWTITRRGNPAGQRNEALRLQSAEMRHNSGRTWQQYHNREP